MAKVLVDGRVLSHAQISGVERYVDEICRAFLEVKSKHSFVIAKPPFGNRIVQHAWEHTYLPILCLKEKADLLFCPANIAPLFRPRQTRLVVTIHGLAFRYYPQTYAKGFSCYYSYLVPRILRSADAILAVSSSEKNSILNQYPWVDQKKIYTVHSGINRDMFGTERQENVRKILSERFGVSGKFILAVGSLTAVKNFHRLIDAFLQIADGTGTGLVLVCGVGPYKYDAGDKITDPRIKLIHSVGQDLPLFYQSAELTVLPSKYEGFGFPALEAMACGCPVVVSNVAALPEICGDAAVYVDPDDTGSIASGIRQVLSNERLRSDLVERGSRRVAGFTWQKTATNTLKVFDEILGEKRASP